MSQSYLEIRNAYLEKAWSKSFSELKDSLGAEGEGDCLHFMAFGELCEVREHEVTIAGCSATGPEGLLVAMYAHFAQPVAAVVQPLKSFKELPGSMPYQGAFHSHAEVALVPHVEYLESHQEDIVRRFSGHINSEAASGDFSFTLCPLPKIPLYYIFHLPDEEFSASVTCLFGANALDFMPLDGLADVAEYTAKRIIGFAGRR